MLYKQVIFTTEFSLNEIRNLKKEVNTRVTLNPNFGINQQSSIKSYVLEEEDLKLQNEVIKKQVTAERLLEKNTPNCLNVS